eukprot:4510373-Karenia_brevis.AAC.1
MRGRGSGQTGSTSLAFVRHSCHSGMAWVRALLFAPLPFDMAWVGVGMARPLLLVQRLCLSARV